MNIEPTVATDEAPPARVGRYEIVATLGQGETASVYLVRGLAGAGFERLAAMKVLHPGLCADREFVEMFLDEARLAARLHHPNTAGILDLGSTGLQPYMVMDYVEGDTLHAVQRAATSVRRAIPVGIALRAVLDALAGLDAAHELRGTDGAMLGLIHRDVSPHNILIGVDGVGRLVDFGIARAASRRGISEVGVVKGNVPFMAPEQLRGHAVDRRADVFSMGVTLWETLALRRCFPTREGSPLSRLAREDYPSLSEVAPKAPAALDAICRRALAVDPADRFATAAEFAAAIEQGFRHDVATQRELAQFMTVVAADKVGREREAVRKSALPVVDRAAPRADRRGRYTPVAAEPMAPPPAQKAATLSFGELPVVQTAHVDAGSLYEALTQALFTRRRADRVAAPGDPADPVTRRMHTAPSVPDSFAASITRRLSRLSVRPQANAPLAPSSLDGPTLPRLAVRLRALAALQAPPPSGGLLEPLRELFARLWSRLAT